ncbi:MAG: DUF3119 family protein [Synechococcales cyanobacterium]
MTLTPDYRLSGWLLLASVPVLILKWPIGIPVALFALFLMLQTALIRLTFSETALEVYRGDTCIRTFPYSEWQFWELYWAGIPVLFYFRETKSIHFLPMLFSPVQLRQCLERYVPLASLEAGSPPAAAASTESES